MTDAKNRTICTNIPGQDAIELVEYYDNFLSYYPNCEMKTKEWFVDNVQPDWVILDCGANIGYYSILFSRLATKGRVHAIEPTSTVNMLKKNLSHNGIENVSIHQVALGNKTGNIQDGIYRIWGQDPEVETYPFMTLDDFVAQNNIERVDCIKIDVDSFDLEVLQGALSTMKTFNPWIVVELNHALACRQQSVPEALFWLQDQGYEGALVLDNDNFILKRKENPTAIADCFVLRQG